MVLDTLRQKIGSAIDRENGIRQFVDETLELLATDIEKNPELEKYMSKRGHDAKSLRKLQSYGNERFLQKLVPIVLAGHKKDSNRIYTAIYQAIDRAKTPIEYLAGMVKSLRFKK